MSDDNLVRDPDTRSAADSGIVEFIDKESGEQVGIFNHDGALARPQTGEVIELVTKSKEEDELVSEDHGRFRVTDVSHTYTLFEWTDEEGEIDAMYGTMRVKVDGPLPEN